MDEVSMRATKDSFFAMNSLVSPRDLHVVFQPIVHLETGEPFAQEALLRCRSPKFNGPLELFEHAMQAGCVGRLGRLVRELAVPLVQGTPLFVNIHPQELQEGWLVRPDDPIFAHDERIFLEITESVPLSHYDLCIDVLKDMRNRGIDLVVDDLGAGYSNLKRIADLEPRVVKLDRDLICGLDRKERQRRLVTSVVRLCTDLQAVVVAEGIETEDELKALIDTGAHYGQGFLLARPSYPVPNVTWPPTTQRASVNAIEKSRTRRRASAG
ncbi:MAG TPA: EAL domain-containing protein [Polyangiaceae bacterium]|nr:EAL domain-containing protein [Polyangiaceae bacterium]